MTSPHLEPTDLPPGPDTEASVASPAIAEQKAEIKDTELPKDIPTETEDPDRVVTPNDSNQAEGRRYKDRQGADVRLDGVGRRRSHRDAQLRRHSGRAALGGARAGHRRKRPPPPRDMAEGADCPSRPAQALSGRALARRAPRSWSLLRWTGWAMCCRPASSRGRAIRLSTRRRWRWSDDPIRCHSLRRRWPTRD